MVRCKSLLAVLALIFLIRALVPVGFMPDFSGQHPIQICSGTELKTIMVDDNGTPSPVNHEKSPCSYAFLSSSLFEASAHVPAFEVPVLIVAVTPPTILALDTQRYLLSPPARAPPSLIA